MNIIRKIAPCLWFDGQAEEAAHFYVGIFKNARITRFSRYGPEGFEIHHHPAGSVMTAECPAVRLAQGQVRRVVANRAGQVDA